MSRGYPSMTVLLGLVAMAGYQNREKIAEWIKAAQSKINAPSAGSGTAAAGEPPGKLGGMLAGTSIGGMLSGGLHDLVNSFKQAGQGRFALPGPVDQHRILIRDLSAGASKLKGMLGVPRA